MKRWLLLLLVFFPTLAQAVDLGMAQLRYPIILVHGATTKGSKLDIGVIHLGDYFYRLPEFLGASGTKVKVVELSTDSSIEERAAVLKNYIETEFRDQKVNLICHSLGGLDARYAASVLGTWQIASISTIGTPHRGTPLADWADTQTKGRKPWYWFFRLLGYDMKQRRFLPELTTHFMAATFNVKVVDNPGVKYFSVRTKASFKDSSMSYLLWFTSRWLEGQYNPMANNGHDGLVPLDSQGWGQVLADVQLDHLGQINHNAFRMVSQSEQAFQVYRNIYGALVAAGL